MVRTTRSKRKRTKLELEELHAKKIRIRKALRKDKGVKRKKILSDVLDQLKKFTERLAVDDLITLGIGVWSYRYTKKPEYALLGMTGYKLAQAPNLPSSMVGIGMLAAVGVCGLPNPLFQGTGGVDTIMLQPEEPEDAEPCPEGTVRKWSILGGWQCVKVHP